MNENPQRMIKCKRVGSALKLEHTHTHIYSLTNGLCATQAFGCHTQIVNLVKQQALSASWQVNAGGIRRVTLTQQEE